MFGMMRRRLVVSDVSKYIISAIIVITMPVWILPVLVIGAFLASVRDVKYHIFDKEVEND